MQNRKQWLEETLKTLEGIIAEYESDVTSEVYQKASQMYLQFSAEYRAMLELENKIEESRKRSLIQQTETEIKVEESKNSFWRKVGEGAVQVVLEGVLIGGLYFFEGGGRIFPVGKLTAVKQIRNVFRS